MAGYASTQNVNNLKKFIEDIPHRGVPPKVSQTYLTSIGFTSSNDRGIVTVCKFLGILSDDGTPTAEYSKLRDKTNAPKALARRIREAYSDLFQTYPDANKKEAKTLRNWFATRTSAGEATINNTVSTFAALCSIADFNGGAQRELDDHEEEAEEEEEKVIPRGHKKAPRHSPNAQVCFNIQVHIPGEQSPEVYESIFKNLGRYVLGVQDEHA